MLVNVNQRVLQTTWQRKRQTMTMTTMEKMSWLRGHLGVFVANKRLSGQRDAIRHLRVMDMLLRRPLTVREFVLVRATH